MEHIKPALDYLDDELSQFPFIKDLEKKTGVPKVYLTSGLVLVASLLLVLNFGGVLISNLIGFVYPAYASFEALETVTAVDDQLWLTYWIVFSFFSVIEVFSDSLLGWFPFYFLLKSVFLIWCYAPQTRGASLIYQGFIRPVLISFRGHVDQLKEDPKKFAKNVTSAAADRLNQVKASLDQERKESELEDESKEKDDKNPFD